MSLANPPQSATQNPSVLGDGFMIGNVAVKNPVVLAPMEDVSNLPFRLLVKEIANPGLMFTEFVSAMAVHFNPSRTRLKMEVDERERPLGIQIFGSDPAIMAETCAVADELGADIIDINMGCWVPKVCKTGSGAALLREPDLAVEIAEAVIRATKKPVTVKVRAGWDFKQFAAPEIAKRFEGVGVQAITLHARFAKQGHEGQADWNLIRQLREAVKVPLIGNGDVKTPPDAYRMLKDTGCDGVMVGRAAIANPWAVARIAAQFRSQEEPPAPSPSDRIGTALKHLRLAISHQHNLHPLTGELPQEIDPELERIACRGLRGQMPLYLKGFSGAAHARQALQQCSTYKDYESVLEPISRIPISEFH